MNVIASSEGSLYELMCRGKKDAYFYQDTKDSIAPFDMSYTQEEQVIREVRRIPPTTGTDFGKTIEFPIDIIGDVLTSVTLQITLPTWLPPTILKTFDKTQITDLSGESYGYVNGIAYFLFEKIQFYQDTTVLQEFSGDYLWCSSLTQGTFAHRFIRGEETGSHDGSAASIGKNAYRTLRLRLPIIGCARGDRGFPLVSTTSHMYKLKCKLRKVEDLVESSAPGKAYPWGISMKNPAEFTSLTKDQMAPLRVELETQHTFLTNASKEALRTTPVEIPFLSIFDNAFTQTAQESTAVAVNRRLDACHPSPRLLWMFRTVDDLNANHFWKTSLSYTALGLTIAGRTREASLAPSIWRDVTNFAKEELDTGVEINTMNWGLGAVAPQKYEFKQADGTINFTTADRPNLYITLQASGATELRVFVEGWSSFLTDGKGRAEVLSFN